MRNEFDIQFREEEKLPHTVIKNVKYFDEEDTLVQRKQLRK
jgi:hypothetical protein